MPKRAAGLVAAKIKHLAPGRWADGHGLVLTVTETGARNWGFRYRAADGRRRLAGLGAFPAVGLAEARAKAADLAKQLRGGVDPLDAKDEARATKAEASAKDRAAAAHSFSRTAEAYIEAHRPGWKNAKHAAQWEATLRTYADPVFGPVPVGKIETSHILQCLAPIWTSKNETASRVRGRVESILDYAAAQGWRPAAVPNPARWRGHMELLLPARAKVAAVEHHAALPWTEAPLFLTTLRGQAGLAARALELLMLTACRTSEVLNARWGEVDEAAAVWTIPQERMKAGKAHRVPLSPAAVHLLASIRPADAAPGAFIFAGQRPGKSLSNMACAMVLRRMGRGEITVHGFRSSFRDWAGDATGYDRETIEASLAHVVGSAVEAAYRRGDALDKRRRLMADWSQFLETGTAAGAEVIPIRRG